MENSGQMVMRTGDGITDENSPVMVRVRASLPFLFENLLTLDETKVLIDKEINILQEKVMSTKTMFHILNSKLLLKETVNAEIIILTDDSPCLKVYDHIESGDDDFSLKRKKRHAARENIQMCMLFAMTPSADGICTYSTPTCVPLIHHEHRIYRQVSIDLPVDVIMVVSEMEPFGNLLEILKKQVCKQLQLMGICIKSHCQSDEFHVPVPHHFKLRDSGGHFVTVLYPYGIDEQLLISVRESLHTELGLPTDRPCLKRANVFKFPEDQTNDGYLTNTHIGISASGVSGGELFVVQGTYTYHHYMQDRFNDDKWGCAYRSLQTLVSWFRHQGYTDHPVPSHSDIQQALVDMGDKEARFVGSRQWIGSTEVSYCLDHMLGVSSKILFVSTGAELGSKGRELAMHFQHQGTPIMIGGGILAHTILGVDFNDVTGDLKFLILDPHYTGAEDLKIIQDKGWCGWKGPDFWDKTAYYNLCMPQRPHMI